MAAESAAQFDARAHELLRALRDSGGKVTPTEPHEESMAGWQLVLMRERMGSLYRYLKNRTDTNVEAIMERILGDMGSSLFK